MARHAKFIDMATKIAERSKCRFKIGAVLVYRGKVISSPNILLRPAEADNFRHSSLHAEEATLRMCRAPKGRTLVCI